MSRRSTPWLLPLVQSLVCMMPACGTEPSAPNAEPGAGGTAATSTTATTSYSSTSTQTATRLRIGHFNIRELTTEKLLDVTNVQVNSAAAILAKFDADIVDINEIQYDLAGTPKSALPGAPTSTPIGSTESAGAENAGRLAGRVAEGNRGYPYVFHAFGNSGNAWTGEGADSPSFQLRGWGEWPGRFNTALLSRYPILTEQARVIYDFAWEDLPGNLIAELENETGLAVPPKFPLFEKALHIVPVDVSGTIIYFVLLHTVAPVFDPINAHRNYDELRALRLFLDGELPGVEPLPAGAKFVVVGDLNADPEDGNGITGAIGQVLGHPSLIQGAAEGAGTGGTNGARNSYLNGCGEGTTIDNPGEQLQLQLDYLLPSVTLGAPVTRGLFFPDIKTDKTDFDLACLASDHRFVHADFDLATAGP